MNGIKKTLAGAFTVTMLAGTALIGSTTVAEASPGCSVSHYNYYESLASVYDGIAHSAFNRNDFSVTDWALGGAAEYDREAQPYMDACNTQEP